MLNIYYYPKANNCNQYANNTIKAISASLECDVQNAPSLKEFVKRPLTYIFSKRVDYLIVNWLESELSNKEGKISILGTLKFFVYLVFFKLIANKLIYVRHNMYPHNMHGLSAKIAQHITNIAEKLFCYKKVAHSGHLTHAGYIYIPHPLYDSVDVSEINKGEYFIIFGKIERYKNIESVINEWNNENLLIIAGAVGDNDYLREIMLLAENKNKNVKFEARFIPDADAEKLVGNSKGLILAHADNDMIVSGSFFYALSVGVPVLARKHPFFDWLVNEKKLKSVFTYEDFVELNHELSLKKYVSSEAILKEAREQFGAEKIKKNWKALLD